MQTPASFPRRRVLALLALPVAGMPHAHAGAPIDAGLALHLLNRLGHGAAPGEVARVRAMGVAAYVDSQLAPPPLPRRLEARLREMADPGPPAGEESLLRAIASPRQLEEVLVRFWQAWFAGGRKAIAAEAGQALLRPHVLGRFAALEQHAKEQGGPVAAGGEREALRALLRHVVSAPSAGLEQALARVWTATGGEQRAVLRALFTNPEFLAPAQWNSKYKDGFRFVAAAVRASGMAVENAAPLMEFLRRPMDAGERADFVERLTSGRLALVMAPPQAHRHASSAPPLRAAVTGEAPQSTVAQPGPVLMEAPTPSAGAMAAAARSQPLEPGRLRELLFSEDFLRY